MRIFSILDGRVTIQDTKHRWGSIFAEWSQDTFESLFGHEFPTDMVSMHLEPARDLYFYATDLNNTQGFTDPDDQPEIKWVKDNWSRLIVEAAGTSFGPDYTFDEASDSWIITPEQQAIIDKRVRQIQRLEKLSSAMIDEFKMILALFQVGKEKGIWQNSDFPAELRTKAANWIQTIADYEAEENS